MKFSDGYWQLRSGVSARYPTQVYDVIADSDSLTVYAPTRPIRQRGDALNQAMITVRCSSPAADVLSVSVSHFLGTRDHRPEFSIPRDPTVPMRAEVTKTEAVITSGALAARFRRGEGWGLEFVADGRVLTSSLNKAMALLDTEPGGRYVREQLSLGVGECVYGLGERFGPLVKNGQVVDIWNADGGTSSEQAYKNVPFYLTNRGYGVFVNHPERSRSRSAPRRCRGCSSASPGESLEYLRHLRARRRRSAAQVHRR